MVDEGAATLTLPLKKNLCFFKAGKTIEPLESQSRHLSCPIQADEGGGRSARASAATKRQGWRRSSSKTRREADSKKGRSPEITLKPKGCIFLDVFFFFMLLVYGGLWDLCIWFYADWIDFWFIPSFLEILSLVVFYGFSFCVSMLQPYRGLNDEKWFIQCFSMTVVIVGKSSC